MPRLVMEYLHGGNLIDQHADSPIAVEEIVVVLYQCLDGLEYLHGENVTHGDIKPENILVSSRRPMSVKLSDFGLARDKTVLQTWCGTLMYCAPEFFKGQPYSKKVDIWSLGVVVFEYAYGLPGTKKRRLVKPKDQVKHDKKWGIDWCERIDEKTEDWDAEDLIELLRGSMLRLDPSKRSSAGDCKKKGLEKGLFDNALHATGNRTPTMRPEQHLEPAVEEASTFILESLWPQEGSPDVERSGPCTHVLDGSVHIHATNNSSQAKMESTSDDDCTSSTSQGPYVRTAKRRRTMDRDYSQVSGPLIPEQLGGSITPRLSTSASLVRGSQHQLPSLPPTKIETYNSVYQSISLGNYAKNQNSQEPTGTQVDDIFGSYIEMTVRDKLVLMCESDASINAFQILNLVQSDAERQSILKSMEEHGSPETQKSRRDGFWVSFETGKSLCQILGLTHELQPLLDLGAGGKTVAATSLADSSGRGKYFCVELDGQHITGRRSDFWVNATHILRATGDKKHQAGPIIKTLHPGMRVENITSSGKVTGIYVSFLDGLLLCREKQLLGFRALLLQQFVTWICVADSEHALDWSLTH